MRPLLLTLLAAFPLINPANGVMRGNILYVSAPDTLTQSNTEYIVTSDFTAPGTALSIAASGISINFNGHTITYDGDALPSRAHGIVAVLYNKSDVEIFGGSLVQSVAVDMHDSTLTHRCPIQLGIPSVAQVDIHNMTLRWRSPDTHGIDVHYSQGHHIHDNVLEDEGELIVNRHQMSFAIHCARTSGTLVHDNVIVRTKQGGISVGTDSETFSNDISIDSRATNSYGIVAGGVSGFSIHDNAISGVGEHPIGIGVIAGAENGIVFSNTVLVDNTLLSGEYGHGIGGHGFRTTWGCDNVEVCDNEFTVYGELDRFGPGQDSYGRGLWVGASDGVFPQPDRLHVHDNVIRGIAVNEGARVPGIAVIGFEGDLHENYLVESNTIESDYACVVLSDAYGASGGYPVFRDNRMRRTSSWEGFRTIREDDVDEASSTGLFVMNDFGEGTGFLDQFFWWTQPVPCVEAGKVDVGLGWPCTVVVLDETSAPVAGATVTVTDNAAEFSRTAITDAEGRAIVEVAEYYIRNCPAYPLPEMVTLDFLAHDAHKVEKNPYTITVSIGGSIVEHAAVIDTALVDTVQVAPAGKLEETTLLKADLTPVRPFGAYRVSVNVEGNEPLSIDVLDVTGRRVEGLLTEAEGRGVRTVLWNPEDLPSGCYIVRVRLGGKSREFRAILVR